MRARDTGPASLLIVKKGQKPTPQSTFANAPRDGPGNENFGAPEFCANKYATIAPSYLRGFMKARIDARRLLAFVVVLVTTMIFSAYFSISSLRALRDRFNSAVDKTAAKMKLGGKHYQVGYVFEPERQRARGIL
jgi:hypothetical protein